MEKRDYGTMVSIILVIATVLINFLNYIYQQQKKIDMIKGNEKLLMEVSYKKGYYDGKFGEKSDPDKSYKELMKSIGR